MPRHGRILQCTVRQADGLFFLLLGSGEHCVAGDVRHILHLQHLLVVVLMSNAQNIARVLGLESARQDQLVLADRGGRLVLQGKER